MSLWTPDGERPVPPANQPGQPAERVQPAETDQPELTPEQEEQARAMALSLIHI